MIQVIHRALDILELLAGRENGTMSLKSIAAETGLNPGTCANILKTLAHRGYVIREADRSGYRLGPGMIDLMGPALDKEALRLAASGPMGHLAESLKEGLILAVLEGNTRWVIHEIRSAHELSVLNKVRKNAYRSSTGRLLIAMKPEEAKQLHIRRYGLPGAGEWPGITTETQFLMTLKKIAEKKLCIQTSVNYITGIAVPVRQDGKAVAALGLYLPEVRYRQMKAKGLSDALKKTARQIELNLNME